VVAGALEGIAWRVADIVQAAGELAPVERLRVDGGLSNDETLLQIQADAVGLALSAGAPDSTVLGAAMLAGVGVGVFASVAVAAELLPAGRVVEPRLEPSERERRYERWRTFVQRAGQLA